MLTRREVSNLTGIGFDTLRFYEKIGLLILPARGPNGYRQYDENVIERLTYIKWSKKCGFTLDEIRKSLGLFDNQHSTMNTDEIIDSKILEIDNKMNTLLKMKKMLLALKEPLKNRNCNQILSLFLDKSEL